VVVERARLRTNPQNRDWQADMAISINKIASALQKQGRLRDARMRFEEEQAIYASLIRGDPKHTGWKSSLATNRAYLGTLLTDLGELEEASKQFAGAQVVASELVAFDPQQVNWRRNLAAILSNASIVERLRARLDESRALASRAEGLINEALREAPQLNDWRRDRANITLRYAEALYASGELATAKRRAGLVLSSVLPAEAAWRLTAADAAILLGRIAADQGQPAAARTVWRQTADSLRGVTIAADGLRLVDRRARALLLLGDQEEARPILEDLRRMQYANPDLMRLPRVAVRARS
jgi:tetratricopeptide (TPR) repeat protein